VWSASNWAVYATEDAKKRRRGDCSAAATCRYGGTSGLGLLFRQLGQLRKDLFVFGKTPGLVFAEHHSIAGLYVENSAAALD
jgi:hypothetical protein